MGLNTFTDIVLYFAVYSVIGWICETIFCSVSAKKLVGRGFLTGPYCPIYGIGAVLLWEILYPMAQKLVSLPLVFAVSMVVTSFLEYVTSWTLEKLFNMSWWDYSGKRFNLKGRISLRNSFLYGFMGVALIYIIQPVVIKLITAMPIEIRTVTASLFIAVLLIDLIATLNGVYKLTAKFKEIKSTLQTLEDYDERFAWYERKDIKGSLERLEAIIIEDGDKNTLTRVEKMRFLLEKDNSGRRLLSTFTGIKSPAFQENIEMVRQSFLEEKYKIAEKIKYYLEWLKPKPQKKTKEKSFAAGLNFYKLFWIFFIGCFIGYVVEILYCFITSGHVESRQGMVYGPFNQVYGLGAVLMVIVLHKLYQKGDRWVFVGSALLGGAFEAVCSLVQEYVFGSVSWNYTGHRFSLFNGRTNLLYMFFWGILGVVFIKEIYPRLSRFVERIPNKQGIVISWVLVVFIALDLLISGLAVYRWAERDKGIEPNTRFEIFLDRHYTDEFLKVIYPNLHFQSKLDDDK